MKTFRKIIFWLHLCSGVLAGIFIFIMCVTGALLSFEPNILEFAESDMRYVQTAVGKCAKDLPIRTIIEKVSARQNPDAKPSNIALQNDPNAAAIVSLGREGQVFVNPYTGEITGEGAKDWRDVFRIFRRPASLARAFGRRQNRREILK